LLSGAGLGVVDVLLSVVVPAQEFEVGEVGGSAVFPVPDVMRFAAAGFCGAAGFGAVAVAGDERGPLGVGDGAVGPPDVEHTRRAVHDHAADPAVARDPLERGARQPLAVRELGADSGNEIGVRVLVLRDVDHHRRMGLPAAVGVAIAATGEVLAADRLERSRP